MIQCRENRTKKMTNHRKQPIHRMGIPRGRTGRARDAGGRFNASLPPLLPELAPCRVTLPLALSQWTMTLEGWREPTRRETGLRTATALEKTTTPIEPIRLRHPRSLPPLTLLPVRPLPLHAHESLRDGMPRRWEAGSIIVESAQACTKHMTCTRRACMHRDRTVSFYLYIY